MKTTSFFVCKDNFFGSQLIVHVYGLLKKLFFHFPPKPSTCEFGRSTIDHENFSLPLRRRGKVRKDQGDIHIAKENLLLAVPLKTEDIGNIFHVIFLCKKCTKQM